MTPDKQFALTNELKEKWDIPSETDAFEFQLHKVIEERCDEFDYYLEQEGFEIIERDMQRVATSIYNYTVIVIKNS